VPNWAISLLVLGRLLPDQLPFTLQRWSELLVHVRTVWPEAATARPMPANAMRMFTRFMPRI
jgi:hypothetical protein